MMRAPISREEYERNAGENVGKDRWYKPELRPVLVSDLPCLVKDYRRRPFLWRNLVGRFSMRREDRAYQALEGAAGVPRYLGRIDGFAIVMEKIESREAGKFSRGELDAAFFDRLEFVVRAMHARGVVHGDLRQRRNILVTPAGTPCLVDFTSAFRPRRGSLLFRALRRIDLSGVAKLKAKHAPESLTDDDRRLLRWDRVRLIRRWRKARRKRRWGAEGGKRKADGGGA